MFSTYDHTELPVARPDLVGGHTLLLNGWDQSLAGPCDPYELFILIVMQLQLPVVGMFQ